MSALHVEVEPDGHTDAGVGVQRLISFELGDRYYCVDAKAVAEVVYSSEVAPVPNSPDWLLGLGVLRGETMAVIDPAAICSSAISGHERPKMLIFHARPNEARFALPIGRLHEISGNSQTGGSTPGPDPNVPAPAFLDHEQLFDRFSRAAASSHE